MNYNVSRIVGISALLAGSLFITSCSAINLETYKDENVQLEESPEVLAALAAAAHQYPEVSIDQAYLKAVVNHLATTIGPRNLEHYAGLNQAASYVFEQFSTLGYQPHYQRYKVAGKEVMNVITSIGPKDAPRIILGAHYDSYGSQPGADDNASGVAGLLAIAKLLKPYEKQLKKRIDLVSYTLEEEMPVNRKHMGSYIHAKQLHQDKVEVEAAISLEMIGFFSDAAGSQDYPSDNLKSIYPTTANFVLVVSDINSSPVRGRFKTFMSKADIRVRSFAAPWLVDGVNRSDHASYWEFGYPGIMVTDTAFYRSPHYHQQSDTVDTLDFSRMEQVVRGAFYGVLNLAL